MYSDFERIINEKGLKVAQVARDTGIRQGVFSDWKMGRYTPKMDKMITIADYLDVPITEIARREPIHLEIPSALYRVVDKSVEEERKKNYVDLFTGNAGLRVSFRIPVLGRVAAGIPIEAQEEILDWEEITEAMARDGEYFGLKIQGDSMEPKFSSGDVIIVRQQDDADDGDIVVALIDGEDATCKKLRKYEDGSVALVSTNPAYPPMFFSKLEVDETPVQIIGKVKELRAKF